MKDEDINKLIQESLLKTTEVFTDKTMEKIDQKKVPFQISLWTKIALLISGLFLLVIPLIWKILIVQYPVDSVLFYIPVIAFIILAVYRWLNLSEAQLNLY